MSLPSHIADERTNGNEAAGTSQNGFESIEIEMNGEAGHLLGGRRRDPCTALAAIIQRTLHLMFTSVADPTHRSSIVYANLIVSLDVQLLDHALNVVHVHDAGEGFQCPGRLWCMQQHACEARR